MTLNFQIRREDALAFSKAYHANSETYNRARARTRWALPILMLVMLTIQTHESGFGTIQTVFYAVISIAWFCLYPKRFDRNAQRYAERLLSEPSRSKTLGPCTLTLADDGLHSTSPMGTSTFTWDAVDHSTLTDNYLHIFLSGPLGYPIRITDIGREAAEQADALVKRHKQLE